MVLKLPDFLYFLNGTKKSLPENLLLVKDMISS